MALNLRDALAELKEPMEAHPIIGIKMAGMSARQILTAGFGAVTPPTAVSADVTPPAANCYSGDSE